MKRLLILVICVIILMSGCAFEEKYELAETEGRVLLCNNDGFMLIHDGSATVLDVDGLDVEAYSDGDLVKVWHGLVQTTYPGKTKAYKIELTEEGSMADIDENVARSLCEFDWLDYDDMVDRYIEAGYIIDCETPSETVGCEYLYCDMRLDIPRGWDYERKVGDNGCYIRFRPKEVNEGWVSLECNPDHFGVCGTGLRMEEDVINGYNVSYGIYDNNKQFSFIRFVGASGDYIVRNELNSDWFAKYENEITSILNTVVLSPGQLTVTEVEDIADGIVDEYESRYIRFDCYTGEWEIELYIDSVSYIYKLNTEGEVIYTPNYRMYE